MLQLPLNAIPNQNFTCELEKRAYNITINDLGAAMVITIVEDGVEIVSGWRCVNNQPILKPRPGFGNFVWFTAGEVYPYWKNFDTSCWLTFMSEQELINAGF